MDDIDIKNIVEAVLMSADKPVSLEQLTAVFEEGIPPAKNDLQQVLNTLQAEYEYRVVELKQLATGYMFQTRAKYALWVQRLQAEKSTRYSRALLETLAIIAYRQPVTRADIEDIRGVGVSSPILKTLLEREWIKVAGHRDVPGKPAVYVTTKAFLDYFNLAGIHQLPPLAASHPPETEQTIEEYIEL